MRLDVFSLEVVDILPRAASQVGCKLVHVVGLIAFAQHAVDSL